MNKNYNENYSTVRIENDECYLYHRHRIKMNRNINVICLSGLARHGKDEMCKAFLKNFAAANCRAERKAHADLLKFIAFGTLDDSWKQGSPDEVAAKRKYLQDLGSAFRESRPDYWVDYILSLLDQAQNMDYAVISDCRYPNEIDSYRDAGYNTLHVRVVRPGFESDLSEEAKNHPSETALNDYPVDILVVNDGTLEDLNDKIAAIVANLCGKENN
jgi:hypothetical protein